MSHETQSFPTKLADFFVALELTIPEDTSAEYPHNDSGPTLKNSFVYPPTDEGFINNIHLFCFPSSTCFPDQLSTPTFFSSGDSKNQYKDAFFHDFVLTDDNGQHRYVTCLKTTSIHIGDSSRRSSLAPLAFLGGSGYINHSDSSLFGRKSIKCFCLVSRRPLFDTLRKCLAEFYMLSRKEKQRSSNSGSKEVLEDFIWSLLHEVILPPPSHINIRVPLLTSSATLEIMTSDLYSPILPHLDYSIYPVFQALSLNNILKIFSSLLLEKSVLFYSTSPTLLIRASQTFLALLMPLQWEMVYIPVVPEQLKEMIEAPTVYVMGGDSSWVNSCIDRLKDRQDSSNSVLLVDLDNNEVRGYSDKKYPTLPGISGLNRRLKHALHPNLASIDKDVLVHFYTEGIKTDDVEKKIRHLFLQWFAEIFGDLRSHFDAVGEFDNNSWLSAAGHSDKPFLKQFSQSIMFQRFVNSRNPVDHVRQDYFDLFAENHLGAPKWIKSRRANEMIEEKRTVIQRHIFDSTDIQCTYNFEINLSSYPSGLDSELEKPRDKTLKPPPVLPASNRRLESCKWEPRRLEQKKLTIPQPYQHLLTSLDTAISENETNLNLIPLVWMRARVREFASYDGYEIFKDYLMVYISSGSQSVHAILKKLIMTLSKDTKQKLLREVEDLPKDLKHQLLESLENESNVFVSTEELNKPRASDETISSGYNDQNDDTADAEEEEEEDSRFDCQTIIDIEESVHKPKRPKFFSQPANRTVLNDGEIISEFNIDDPIALSQELLMMMLAIYRSVAIVEMEQAGTESESCVGFTITNSVLLQEMKESSLYDDFKHSVTLLREVNIDGLNTDERLCFFLNVRNLLIMHSCIEHEPPSSLYQRLTYTGPSYNIGGEYYSTNEITSGILRATLSIPSILGINVLPFANFNPRDRRYKYRIDSEHPILNFVLPDGTKTSPRIVVYHLHKLYDQLKKQAIQYIDTEFEYIPKKKRVMMPQYFSWYYKDFGYYPSDVLLWIFQNLPDCKLSNLMVSQDLIKQDTKNSIIRVSRKLSVKYKNCPVEFGFKLAV